MVDGAGQVRLTDFGIAKRLDDIEENLTSAGMVVGTPTYLAPEQAAGDRLSVATDVYLVGLVLDEMLTGRRPTGSALDPRRARADVPPAVADAVVRATDPDPRRRFQSAQEMIEALRAAPSRVATLVFPATAGRPSPAAAPATGHTTVMPGNHPIVDAEPTRAIAPVLVDPVEAGPRPGPRMSGWWLLATAAIVLALGRGPAHGGRRGPRLAGPSRHCRPPARAFQSRRSPSAPPTTALVVPPAQDQGGNDQGNGHGQGKKKDKGKGDG